MKSIAVLVAVSFFSVACRDGGSGATDAGGHDASGPDGIDASAELTTDSTTGGSTDAPATDATGGESEGGTPPDAAAPPMTAAPDCQDDITAQILANTSVVLAGDSCVLLPAGTTQYDGTLSGAGTLTLQAPNGLAVLVITGDSTFALPATEQTETVTETANAYTIHDSNPPAVFIELGATLQLGTATSTTGSVASNMPNTGSAIINVDNIEVDGTLAMGGGPTEHFGILSGSGAITQPGNPPPAAIGTFYLVGDDPFAGIFVILTGGYVGDLGVEFSLPFARAIFNDGSMLMNSPPSLGYTLPQTVYEDHYGDDVNTDHGLITFSGVYSYSDSGDRLHPSLSDPSLNTRVVTNTGASPLPANGSNASFRGINLEGGTTVWGDGTTNAFFLPSTPAPADPGAKNVKNAYINLRNNGGNSTLVWNYNGTYTCNIGITGGGGGPHAEGDVGGGNLTLAATPGNHAVLTMPQNYDGTTTIGAGATLQLGNGAPVQSMGVGVGAPTAAAPGGAVTTSVLATYSGDSSLLIAESSDAGAADSIVDDGTLIVDNTTTPIALSNISGAGGFVQLGSAPTTLLANTYSGGTTVTGGMLIVGSDTSLGTGSVTNDAGLGLASGQHVIHVAGDYEQGSAGTLALGVGGTVQGTSYDFLAVTGKATLSGALVVSGIGAFAPSTGQQFVLVQATGGITGTFAAVTSAGIKLAVTYDATRCYATVM